MQLASTVTLNKINFNLYPYLKALVFNISRVINEAFYELPISIKTSIFNNTYTNNYHYLRIDGLFTFHNLLINLKKNIFEHKDIDDKTYKDFQVIIINKIKNSKFLLIVKFIFVLPTTINILLTRNYKN